MSQPLVQTLVKGLQHLPPQHLLQHLPPPRQSGGEAYGCTWSGAEVWWCLKRRRSGRWSGSSLRAFTARGPQMGLSWTPSWAAWTDAWM
ncbi:hypothetical protein COCON_G00212430 [Conger conger]|uniref:Uncharacterized protein n=1 Tax=Conger conger TaxID=82655 RepID=A0A9Q1HNX9_CONCO|nr:hypothetical protein COCON_G00212430 [Conger conger]